MVSFPYVTWVCKVAITLLSSQQLMISRGTLLYHFTAPLEPNFTIVIVREAAKKVLLLMTRPIRPYPPPPNGLNGHRTFFCLLFLS